MVAVANHPGWTSAKNFGAVGNFSADDTAALQAAINYCFGTAASPHGGAGGAVNNKTLYIPPGRYKITSPLVITGVEGGQIEGAGRFSTIIQNTNSGGVFQTNGFQYSTMSKMRLVGSGTAACVDLDYDGLGTWNVNLQSNTFSDLYCDGGAYGFRIGKTGYVGSENSFINCFFANHTEAGLAVENYNALQNTMIGGNIQGCKIGILVNAGSVPIIHGVGFQSSTQWDIKLVGQATGDAYSILSCRSESDNFLYSNGHIVHMAGCGTTLTPVGYLVDASGGFITVENCTARRSKVRMWHNCRGAVRNSAFGNSSALEFTNLGSDGIGPGVVEVENVCVGGLPTGSGDAEPGTYILRRRYTDGGAYEDYTLA